MTELTNWESALVLAHGPIKSVDIQAETGLKRYIFEDGAVHFQDTTDYASDDDVLVNRERNVADPHVEPTPEPEPEPINEEARRLTAFQLATHVPFDTVDEYLDAAYKIDNFLRTGGMGPADGGDPEPDPSATLSALADGPETDEQPDQALE